MYRQAGGGSQLGADIDITPSECGAFRILPVAADQYPRQAWLPPPACRYILKTLVALQPSLNYG